MKREKENLLIAKLKNIEKSLTIKSNKVFSVMFFLIVNIKRIHIVYLCNFKLLISASKSLRLHRIYLYIFFRDLT